MPIFYEYDLDSRFTEYAIMHIPNWVKVCLKISRWLWFVSGLWLMFIDTLNVESLKGFINESFSSCSSVKIAHVHMDVSVCRKLCHGAQLLRRPGKFGTTHNHFPGTWFKFVYFFSSNWARTVDQKNININQKQTKMTVDFDFPPHLTCSFESVHRVILTDVLGRNNTFFPLFSDFPSLFSFLQNFCFSFVKYS